MNTLLAATNVTNSVGFGTAALGQQCHNVVLMALEAGFRYFDTAEENQYWYNSQAVASALREFHQQLLLIIYHYLVYLSKKQKGDLIKTLT